MQDVLLLNADFTPIRVVSWKRALVLLMGEKVRLVAAYPNRFVRSPSLTLAWPAVVSLARYARFAVRPKLNRRHILARDQYRCQYCGFSPVNSGGRPDMSMLTMDHVVPKAQAVDGRVRVPWVDHPIFATSWQNLVTACADCNHRKADRTPVQAGLKLRSTPRIPGAMDGLRITLDRMYVPPEWAAYMS